MDNTKKSYESLLLIVMIYMTIDLSSMVFAYKLIKIGPVIFAASSLIFPLTYSIMDITAEIYGYKTAKKIILYSFLCDFIFSILTLWISHIPSINPSETTAYAHTLGHLLRAVVAQSIGVLVGAFFNIHLISRWKIMTKGRYFWLRSIGSSTIGEATMLIISVFIALIGMLSISELFKLIAYTYIYKIFFAFAAAPVITIVTTILKNKGCGENNDYLNLKSLDILNNTNPYPIA